MNFLKRTSFSLLGLLLIVLITATIVEKTYDTSFALEYIYHSQGFVALWVLLTVSAFAYIIKRKMYRRPNVFLLHISFIVILIGAFFTHILSEEGNLHLRKGMTVSSFIDKDGMGHRLPFSITLDSFKIEYYSGSHSPSDYVSRITISDKGKVIKSDVSMNNIFQYEGYRFYQAGYDEDECGTIFLVNHDPIGISITYVGYTLLFLSMFLFLFSSKSHFKELIKSPLLKKAAFILLLLVMNPFASYSSTKEYQQQVALYNSLSNHSPIAMVLITLGIIAFVYFGIRSIKKIEIQKSVNVILNAVLVLAFVYITALIALRWYISSHIPLSNGFETMQFASWCFILLTLFMQKRFKMILSFGLVLSGLALMVSTFGDANPQITHLAPVLSSPLLSVHVMVIMIAYSLFAFMMLNGIMAFIMKFSLHDCDVQIERLRVISNILLYPALFLLTAGIFIGAIWANVSWGSYWGWDPKEVWALITMLIYSLALHQESLPLFKKTMFFHLFSIIAFLTVLITYFGVNFILGGMHSYA